MGDRVPRVTVPVVLHEDTEYNNNKLIFLDPLNI